MTKYRVMSWIPVEPDESVEQLEVLKEAIDEARQAQLMQPENRYEVQQQDEEGEWERVPAYMYAAAEQE